MPRFFLLFMAAMFICSGCKRELGPPPPLAVEQIPAEFDKTFKTAASDLQELALQVSLAVQTNGYTIAFGTVQALCSTSGMSKEQSLLASRAMLALSGVLQTKQEQGDQNAGEALKYYQMTK